VANRVASRAQVDSARRRAIEGQKPITLAVTESPPAEARAELDEDSTIVHQEVSRLPENYRAVIILCYWEAMTQEQAAAHLGCPLGTIRSRMARGKEILKKRLSRRGLAPSDPEQLESLLGFSLAGSSVPSGLLTAVVKAGSELASGRAFIDITSASVALLSQQTLRSLVMMKLKTAVACVGIVSVGALGVGMAGQNGHADRPKKAADRVIKTAREKAQPPLESEADYRVNPPDMIIVDVLEALPGRPISGERLIRPDGKISLGVYGEIYVAGLTTLEVKEKVIQLLRKFINDETLGLVKRDPDTGEPVVHPDTRKVVLIDFKDSDRVFVDITAYNSRNFYIQGEVVIPGRLPVTGGDRVLDAISYAGGMGPRADRSGVKLYRTKQDGTTEVLPIDIDQLLLGDDLSTNYQLKAGDRLVVPTDKNAKPNIAATSPASATMPTAAERYFPGPKRRKEQVEVAQEAASETVPNHQSPQALERRLTTIERKLDAVLAASRVRDQKSANAGQIDQ
jgi:protein involved in polysaccharide export with SLBB domain